MKVRTSAMLAQVWLGSFGGALWPGWAGLAAAADGGGGVVVRSFQPERPLSRARRLTRLTAVIENTGGADAVAEPALVCPPGVRAVHAPEPLVTLGAGGGCAATATLQWDIKAETAMTAELRLGLKSDSSLLTSATLSMLFLPPVKMRKASYVPEPAPVKTDIFVGALNRPLWEPNASWAFLSKHPERMPALGRYDQTNPEVADWETKWAVEHGISFFVYCWYRAGKTDAVETKYSSAIDALLKSRYIDKFKFAIMWENQPRDAATWGESGVSGEKDLMDNLMPFWMKHYFTHPSYLKIDKKPLLFIYDTEQLARQLGGAAGARNALAQMREVCKREGFDGLTILGECRGLAPKQLEMRRAVGFDYLFPYVWPVGEPWRAVDMQLDYMRMAQVHGVLPWVLTASQGWSGWGDGKYIYTLSPDDYEGLLRRARKIIAARPPGELGSRMFLLDNWNEWGEGHYIAPYRQYGFGYLDAVRKVFSNAPEKHVDLLPEDIGLGPYDFPRKRDKK